MTRLARPYDSSRTPLILENSIHLSYPLPRARAAFVAAVRGLVVAAPCSTRSVRVYWDWMSARLEGSVSLVCLSFRRWPQNRRTSNCPLLARANRQTWPG